MDKIKELLKKAETWLVGWITPIAEKVNLDVDKMLHLVVSFIITILFVKIFGSVGGVTLTLLTFILKEFYDSKKENPTGFDKEDIKFDLYGMVTALILMLIF